jgi:hypothetical protein
VSYCYICRDGFGAVLLADCDATGPRGPCGKAVQVCRACARSSAEELERAVERWEEEHACARPRTDAMTAQRYLDRGLADLHSARVRLEAAGYHQRARELSERLRPIEALYAAVKGANETNEGGDLGGFS